MFSKGFTKAKKGKSTSCKNYTQIISNVQNPHLGRLRRSLDQLLSKSEVDRSHIEISGTRIDPISETLLCLFEVRSKWSQA